MNALFTAFDISGLSANIATVLFAGVGIMLLFLGYRMLRKAAYELGFGPAIDPWGEEVGGYKPLNPSWNYESYKKRQVSKSIRRHNKKRG